MTDQPGPKQKGIPCPWEAVKRYIQEQQGKDVFEYSVFGSPQQKIGDFTQSKLARWSS